MVLGLLARMWALPNTLLGLLLVPAAFIGGGRVGVMGGVLEAYGGLLVGLLRLWPPFSPGSAAVTLGHVVLAMTQRDLEESRAHERVHVRQYERWGPLFLPAYALASLWAWVRGRDPYTGNRFEREAVARTAAPGRGSALSERP
ncbi:MAG TPA: hypothetical protein VFT32_11675 [Candidatus Eisenbacteria bacterium]|nr:hypothetical protein [Candidatus Eisenbacteria bacterium]